MSKALKYALSVALAAVLLYFAFRSLDWRAFVQGLAHTDWWYIIVSMLAGVAALVFRAERWRLQLIPLNPEIGRGTIWHGSNIGNLLSIIIPGTGEFYRCGFIAGKSGRYDKVFGTIVMERSWDLLAVGMLLVLAVLGSGSVIGPFMQEKVLSPLSARMNLPLALAIALGAVAAASLGIFLLRRKVGLCGKICEAVKGILQGFSAFGAIPRKGLFLLYTACIWAMYVLMTYFTFLAIPELTRLSLLDALFISAVGNIASVIPTPGNLGAYHYLVGIALSSLYIPAEMALGEPGTIGLLCATLSHGSHALLLGILALWSWIAVTVRKR